MNSWVKNGCRYALDDNGNLVVGYVEVVEPKAKGAVAKEVKAESKPKSTKAKAKKK